MDQTLRDLDDLADQRKRDLFQQSDIFEPQSDKRTQITADAEEFLNPLDVYSLLDILPVDVLVSQLYSQNIVTARILQQLKVLDENISRNASEASKSLRYKQFAQELYNQTEDVSDINRDVFWKRFTMRCYPYITRLPPSFARSIPDQPEPKSESEKRKAQIKTRVIQNRLWKLFFLGLINMPFVLDIQDDIFQTLYRPQLNTSMLLSCDELVNRTYEYKFVFNIRVVDYVRIDIGQQFQRIGLNITPLFDSVLNDIKTGKLDFTVRNGRSEIIAVTGKTMLINARKMAVLEIDVVSTFVKFPGGAVPIKEQRVFVKFNPFNVDDELMEKLTPVFSDGLLLQKYPLADLLAVSSDDVYVTVRKKLADSPDLINIAEFQFPETRTIDDLSDYIETIDSSTGRLEFYDTDTGISYGCVFFSSGIRGFVNGVFFNISKTTLRQLGFSKNLTVEIQG